MIIHLAFQAEHPQNVGAAVVLLEEVHLDLTIPLGLALLIRPVLSAFHAAQLNTSGGGKGRGEGLTSLCTQLEIEGQHTRCSHFLASTDSVYGVSPHS